MTSEHAPNAPSAGKKPVWGRLLFFVGSLIVLTTVVVVLLNTEDTIDVTQKDTETPRLPVTVEQVVVGAQPIRIEAYSAVVPRWSANISAAISGRIIEVSDQALAGNRIEQGTILARIEPSRYDVELAQAKLSVQQAELALWQAENAHELAKRQFKRTGDKPPNRLALKLPQLDIAKASLERANASLKAAQEQIDNTIIKAPFSGFVTERFISPGQSVNTGDKLVHLVDDRVFELVAHIDAKKWARLKHPLKGQAAVILNAANQTIATAKVREAAGFLDTKTRQHKIFLSIDAQNYPDILSGDFLKVSIPGRNIDHAVSLPASARTQDGFVWRIDTQNRLQRMTPELLYTDAERIIVKIDAGDEHKEMRIAVTPLASFLPGQIVDPIVKADNDHASVENK